MASLTSSVSRATAALVVTVLAASALSACTPKPQGPAPTAEAFFAALATGDTATAADLADKPADAE